MANLQLQIEDSLDQRIIEFKTDPERMKVVDDFLNQLIEQARIEAEQKMNTKQKNKFPVQEESAHGLVEHAHRRGHSPQEFLQQYAIVPPPYVTLQMLPLIAINVGCCISIWMLPFFS